MEVNPYSKSGAVHPSFPIWDLGGEDIFAPPPSLQSWRNIMSTKLLNKYTHFVVSGACGRPPAIVHAYVPGMQAKYSVGSVIKYACRRGYSQTGRAFVYCQNDRTWSHATIKCSSALPSCGRHGLCAHNIIAMKTVLLVMDDVIICCVFSRLSLR